MSEVVAGTAVLFINLNFNPTGIVLQAESSVTVSSGSGNLLQVIKVHQLRKNLRVMVLVVTSFKGRF